MLNLGGYPEAASLEADKLSANRQTSPMTPQPLRLLFALEKKNIHIYVFPYK